jgi:hypothetical protein
LLVRLRVVSKFTRDRYHFDYLWMGKIPVAALSAPLKETRRFKFANEISDLPRHIANNATAMPESLTQYA